eukprot:COSAG02_NODE_2274_length_9257_cov_21.945840_6_plen_86_part_00
MAAEDPNRLKNTAKVGASMATADPSKGGMMMAAASTAAALNAPSKPTPEPVYAPDPQPVYRSNLAPAAGAQQPYGSHSTFQSAAQ